MGNLIKVKQIKGGAEGQVIKTNSSGKSIWGTDIHATNLYYDSGAYELKITMSDSTDLTADLASLTNDVSVTGGTYNSTNGRATFYNNDGGNFTVDGFMTGMTDSYTDGASLNGNTLSFNNTTHGNNFYQVDLSSLLTGYVTTDSYATSGSYNTSTNTIDFSGVDNFGGFSVSMSALSASLSANTFLTGGSIAFANDDDDDGSLTLNLNDGSQVGPISGFRDTHVNSANFNSGNNKITFTNNRGNSFDVDLSSLDVNDEYVNSGDVTDGTLTLTRDIGTPITVTGNIIQSIVGTSPINVTTTNGVSTIDIDSSSLSNAIQYTKDKCLAPSNTSGDEQDTGIQLGSTPVGNVKVEINGVGYCVAKSNNERTTSDCYFGTSSGTAKDMTSLSFNDKLYWNGTQTFDLEETDRVDLFYEIMQ